MKVFLALAFAALAVTTAAEASLVVGNSLTGPFGIGTNYGLKAAGFTTGAASTHVNAVGVALTGAVGSIQLDGTISFTINGDLSGAPGAALTSVSSFTLAPNAPPAVYSFSPVS